MAKEATMKDKLSNCFNKTCDMSGLKKVFFYLFIATLNLVFEKLKLAVVFG